MLSRIIQNSRKQAGLKFFSTRIEQGLLHLNSDITRIRVWKSGYFKNDGEFVFSNPLFAIKTFIKPGYTGNVGHVSIETHEMYASLWPRDGLTLLDKLKIHEGRIVTSPEHDEVSEGRKPDHLVDLCSLDRKLMREELDAFLSENAGRYHIVGPNILFNRRNAESCSSLAYRLLTAGGIGNLVPSNSRSELNPL